MSHETFLRLTPGQIFDAVDEHYTEVHYINAVNANFAASICNSSGNLRQSITGNDLYKFDGAAKKATLDPNSKEGKERIEEVIDITKDW